MTAQRRARNALNSRRKWGQRRRRSQSTSDEGSSDGGSVTRCICGEIHNVGLMVQCDKCEVWQHCDCVGLEEQDIPEQYYCEECKPENHSIIRLSHGRTRRSYSSQGHPPADRKAPKKRMTLNSREASMSLEDVLAARSALELATSVHNTAENSPVGSPTESSPIEGDEHGKRVKRLKGIAAQEQANEDEVMEEATPQPAPSVASSVGHREPVDSVKPEDETIDSEAEAPPSKPKRTQGQRSKPDETSEVASVMNARPKRARAGKNRTNGSAGRRGPANKPRSRTSTPQPSESPHQQVDIGTSIFEHFSAQARETSPPARVRYPSGRMTIPEMNRRAKQILEYISSMQVEMANKHGSSDHGSPEKKPRHTKSMSQTACPAEHHTPSSTSPPSGSDRGRDGSRPANGDIPDIGAGTGRSKRQQHVEPITIPETTGAASPSSSLSSASTIPLDDTNPPSPRYEFGDDEKGTAEEAIERVKSESKTMSNDEQSSMELMDLLTRELIKFQRRFGSGSHSHKRHDLPLEDNEGEGRVTRSREISALVGLSRGDSEKRSMHMA